MKSKVKTLSLLLLILCLLFSVALGACSNKKDGFKQSTLSISKDYLEIEKGFTADLFAGYDGEKNITFVVLDDDIVGLTYNGGHAVLTANKVGVTYVEISVDGQAKTCKVVVYESEYSILLDREENNTVLWVNVQYGITATVYKDGNKIDVNVSWKVSGGDCDVTNMGNRIVLKPKQTGEYVVSVNYEDFVSSEYRFTVVNEGL